MADCTPVINSGLATRLATLKGASLHVFALLAFVACDNAVVTQSPKTIHLSLQAGDRQTAEVGTSLPQALVVQVNDQTGAPVQGIDVIFTTSSRSGVSATARSDALGRASVLWQLGEVAGDQWITASAQQPTKPAFIAFRARALAGQTSQMAISPTTDFLAAAGTELDTLTATLTDRFGNPTTFVTIDWSIESGGGTVRPLRGNSDETGRARAAWTLGSGSGRQSLAVSAGSARRTVVALTVNPLVARQVVAGSDHSCALTMDGTAHCWGTNGSGQLGIGALDVQPHRVPMPVRDGLTFKSLVAGASHTCGLALDGSTWCWGYNQSWPASEERWSSAVPVQVPGAPQFTEIVAGQFHTCGLTSAGAIYCWGDNSLGQLGRGTDRSDSRPYYDFLQQIPAPVVGGHFFTSMAAAYGITCGVTISGESYCWGENTDRTLGSVTQQICRVSQVNHWDYGSPVFEIPCGTSPVPVSTRARVKSLTLDRHTVCAVLTTSELECWGNNASPALVPGAHVSTAWALWGDVCGLQPDDSVKCWRMRVPFAESMPFGSRLALVNLHSGGSHHCGLSRDQVPVAYCWGANNGGALGDGTTLHRSFPVPVTNPVAATATPQRSR